MAKQRPNSNVDTQPKPMYRIAELAGALSRDEYGTFLRLAPDELDVHRDTLYRWMKKPVGSTPIPADKLAILAALLGVSPDALLNYTPAPLAVQSVKQIVARQSTATLEESGLRAPEKK